MALIDNTDVPSFYMNPSAWTQVKGDGKKEKGKAIRRNGDRGFSRIFDEFRIGTSDDPGPVRNLPVSEETVTMLMDEVHSTGSALQERPCADEIVRYKQAVRNFMYYVVENGFTIEHEKGLPRYMQPGFTGNRGTDLANEKKPYTKIHIIDKKLDNLAAGILAGQLDHLKIIAGLEEINGLLIDLLQ